MDIWVTADTHFFHENILKFKDVDGKKFRGDLFQDVGHMNEVMVDNWNSKVKPTDKIYHLGDVFMGRKEDFKKLWPRLNGRKNLIVGNHDDIKFLSNGAFFKKVYFWRYFKEFNLTLTHVPLHETSFPETVLNVHGHIHQNPSPTPRHKCVCVEQTNYSPIHIEELNYDN